MGAEISTITVDVTPEQFYSVITDYEKYPEFVSTVKDCKITKRSDHTAEVYFEIDLFKSVKYTLKMTEVPQKKLTWEFLEGDFFKVNSGFWKLSPAKGGKATKAEYSVEVDFALFVPKMITKKLVSVSLPKNMEEFKDRAESLYA